MNADLVRVLVATVAPFIAAGLVWWLVAGLLARRDSVPEPSLPDPAVEAERRRLRALEVAAHFPAPPATARAPYVASGRAGRVERECVTVAFRAGTGAVR